MNIRMKHPVLAAALAAVAGLASAGDVSVSIRLGQPGFYGRLDIGDYPPPVLIYPEPVLIARPPVGVVRAPVYLHVPPGHASNWRRHCGRYNACGRPVYFVQNNWYDDVYVPRYRERHPPPPGHRYRERDRGYDDPRYGPGYRSPPPPPRGHDGPGYGPGYGPGRPPPPGHNAGPGRGPWRD